MEIIGYLFLSVVVMAIIAIFVKILTYTFKTVVDNSDD